jgi:hypothetical protein
MTRRTPTPTAAPARAPAGSTAPRSRKAASPAPCVLRPGAMVCTLRAGEDIDAFQRAQLAAMAARGCRRLIVDLRFAEVETWTAGEWRMVTAMCDTGAVVCFVVEPCDLLVADYWALLHGERGLMRPIFAEVDAAVTCFAWWAFKAKAMGELAPPWLRLD